MAIKEFQINFPGQGVNPRFGHLSTTNTLAQVTAAGYLNPYMKSQGFSILPSDFIFVYSSASPGGGSQIYKPTFAANGQVTLATLP